MRVRGGSGASEGSPGTEAPATSVAGAFSSRHPSPWVTCRSLKEEASGLGQKRRQRQRTAGLRGVRRQRRRSGEAAVTLTNETSQRVAEVFARVPRHPFIPDRIWDSGEPVDQAADPDRWQRLVAADDAVVTQVDDGVDGGWGIPSSSSSAPSIMAAM